MKKQKSIAQQLLPTQLRAFLLDWRDSLRNERLIKSLKGNEVSCNICESQYRAFAPYGRLGRSALCPKCGAVERHRLLWKYLHEKTDLFQKKQKVLHFAPEKCFYHKFVSQPNIEYFPVDLFPEIFVFDRRQLITEADITNLPFPDNHFDVIICNHVLEHIPDDAKAMSELYRVAKKQGGWGICQVPIDYEREATYEDFSITEPAERQKAFGQIDHVRWYGQDYPERLAAVGFKVEEDPFCSSFTAEQKQKWGLPEEELIYKVNA